MQDLSERLDLNKKQQKAEENKTDVNLLHIMVVAAYYTGCILLCFIYTCVMTPLSVGINMYHVTVAQLQNRPEGVRYDGVKARRLSQAQFKLPSLFGAIRAERIMLFAILLRSLEKLPVSPFPQTGLQIRTMSFSPLMN